MSTHRNPEIPDVAWDAHGHCLHERQQDGSYLVWVPGRIQPITIHPQGGKRLRTRDVMAILVDAADALLDRYPGHVPEIDIVRRVYGR